MLNIRETMEKDQAILTLEGRLDTVTAPELEKAIAGLPEETGALRLDFAALEYISSAGLRVLLSAQKRMAPKGGLRVAHVCPAILEIFEVTGFSDILTIE